jgi:Zn-dependent protease/CBS domain-containing protein
LTRIERRPEPVRNPAARPAGGVRLGRIAGIEVVADWSLLVIFFLISFSLAAGVFPSWHPDWGPGLAWATAFGAAILFLASVLVHELSHALVGRLGGMSVRRITLFMFGGVAHLESEPRTWRSELAMAAVGPITSLALGIAFLFLAGLAAGPIELDPQDPGRALAELSPLATLLFWLGPVNLLLAAFNLVPGFPLDGGRMLRAILWGATGNLRAATRWASRGGQLFAWMLIATGLLMLFGFAVPFFGRGPLGGLWLMFIGWFLNNAAVMGYRQLVVAQTLDDVPVAHVMQTQLARIDPQVPVRRLAEEHMMASGQRVLPVERDGRFLGLVSMSDLQRSERGAWDRMSARDIMTPVERLACIGPGAEASEALNELARRGVNQLPVVEDGRLLGLFRREDVFKWLALHEAPAPADTTSMNASRLR